MEVIMSLKFFLMYELVCQNFYKKILKNNSKEMQKAFFFFNCDFLNCRNMIVLITLFIDFIIKL